MTKKKTKKSKKKKTDEDEPIEISMEEVDSSDSFIDDEGVNDEKENEKLIEYEEGKSMTKENYEWKRKYDKETDKELINKVNRMVVCTIESINFLIKLNKDLVSSCKAQTSPFDEDEPTLRFHLLLGHFMGYSSYREKEKISKDDKQIDEQEEMIKKVIEKLNVKQDFDNITEIQYEKEEFCKLEISDVDTIHVVVETLIIKYRGLTLDLKDEDYDEMKAFYYKKVFQDNEIENKLKEENNLQNNKESDKEIESDKKEDEKENKTENKKVKKRIIPQLVYIDEEVTEIEKIEKKEEEEKEELSKINEEINNLKNKGNIMEIESEPSVEEINVTGRERRTKFTKDEADYLMKFFN